VSVSVEGQVGMSTASCSAAGNQCTPAKGQTTELAWFLQVPECLVPSTKQPPAEPTTQPPAEPTTQPPAEPTTQPPTEPTTQSPTEPTTQSPTEPTTQPPTEPTPPTATTEKPTSPAPKGPGKYPSDSQSLQRRYQ